MSERRTESMKRYYQENRAGRLWSDVLGVTYAHRHSEQVRFDRKRKS